MSWIPNYVPILSIRPAEVTALSELPDVAKDNLTPLILIKPWLGRGSLSRAVDKILHGFSSRAWYAELDPEFYPNTSSDSIEEIISLRDPANGFLNWMKFVESYENAIPVLQLSSLSSETFSQQLEHVESIGRGFCIRIPRNTVLNIEPIINSVARFSVDNCTIVLDYGQQDYRLLVNVLAAISEVKLVLDRIPEANIVISATTFPSSFTDISDQDIYEREFFNMVINEVGSDKIIFSDRGSTRAENQGGGGVPRPRIDLPGNTNWWFFRSDCVRDDLESDEEFRARRLDAYQEMAEEAVNSSHWDPELNIWGTQLIKITQLGSEFGITSPAKATSSRINIHLTRQAFYGQELSGDDFEEDWED